MKPQNLNSLWNGTAQFSNVVLKIPSCFNFVNDNLPQICEVRLWIFLRGFDNFQNDIFREFLSASNVRNKSNQEVYKKRNALSYCYERKNTTNCDVRCAVNVAFIRCIAHMLFQILSILAACFVNRCFCYRRALA